MRVPAVFFASSNAGKIREVTNILGEVLPDLRVYSLQDFPTWSREVDECGDTYHDNAYLKAQAYLDNPENLPVIADDSGLEVAAFPGLLGIHSSRWCDTRQQTKAEALFAKLQETDNRRMTFHTTFCFLQKDKQPLFFDSELTGRAADKLTISDGFDYDPIFIPDGYDQTYGQLGQKVKNKISQRRRALEALAHYLSSTD